MAFLKKLKRSWDYQMRLRKTVAELSSLSDRELHDIGISRSDIYSVVMEDMTRKAVR